MKLFRHLLWTDVRHFKWLIAATVVAFAGSAVLNGIWPIYASRTIRVDQLGVFHNLLWFVSLALLVISVPLVMHEHPLVGSDAFWMTRPVPPRTLMASKAVLLAGLVIVFPVLCDLVLMAVSGTAPGPMARVAFQTALWQAFALAALMVAAAVTASLTRYIVLWVGAALAVVVLVSVMIAFASAQMEESTELMAVSVGVTSSVTVDGTDLPRVVDFTDQFVFLVLIVAGAAAVVAVQAWTRLRRWSAAAGAASVVIAMLAAGFWPWPFLRARLESPAWAASSSALQLHGEPDSVRFHGTGDSPWLVARGLVTLAGLEPGWEASMRIGRGTLDLPGGGRLTTGTIGTADPLPLANEKRTQARVLLTGVLGVERLAFQETYEAVSQSSLFRVRRSDYDPHVPSSAVYRASAFVDLSRKEVAAAVPLRPGAQHNEGSYRFAIERAGFEQERLVIRARVYRATSMFDRRPAPVFSFFVRNPGLKEALQGFESGVRATGLPFWSFDVNSGRASGFWAGAVAIRFPDWSGIVTDPITVTNTWLDGAELVIVRETAAASIPRTLEMSGVPLRPPVPLR